MAVTIITKDGSTHVLETSRKENLLNLCLDAGIDVTTDCRTGSCCTDPVQILEGWDNLNGMGEIEEQTLVDNGYSTDNHRLLCMCRLLEGDAILKLLKD